MSVRVPPQRAEEARGLMLELFPEGFEEIDLDDGGVELAAYAGAGGEERLWRAFGPGEITEVAPDWREAWKRFHRPVRVGPLWIGPPWSRPDTDAVPIVIDPGRAFGTGSHPTTRLCLELLLEREPTSVVDLGCGSGVLAIAAAKVGFSPVFALDYDEAAVEATRANAAVNSVRVVVERCDVLTEPLPETELALANIAFEPVQKLATRIPSPLLIVSGYLASERVAPLGWRQRGRREAYGWAADLLGRASSEP